MKATRYRALQIVLYIVLGATVVISLTLAMGCASTDVPSFDAPPTQPVPFPIPVPPAERTCVDVPLIGAESLSLAAVEGDGSTLIQALTEYAFVLAEVIQTNYNECRASNEARQLVIEAAREAQAELERLIAEAQQ